MYYVYLLQSESEPTQRYVGFTSDLKARIATHNGGGSPHTSKYGPWRLVTYLAFSAKGRALEFERYLKSHSGKGFAAKRLW
jgi:putative endonuclease